MKKETFKERIHFDTASDTAQMTQETEKIIRGIDQRFQEKTFQNMKKREELIVHIRENVYGKRKVVQSQFKTIGCRMKKAGSCWNCNYGVLDHCLVTPNQYISEFSQALEKTDGDVLVLEALGSITDPKEFSPEVLKEVIKIAIQSEKFPMIMLETHISQIKEELVEYIREKNQGKKRIGFEVGIEDMNPENRKFIHKLGVNNQKIEEVYQMLDKNGMTLSMNLIYGFPFMIEEERMKALYCSIKQIHQDYPNAEVTLFLMSVKENTMMEYMKQKGHYQLPNPWGLVEVTKQLLNRGIDNTITYSWFGEKQDPYIKETTAYTCPHCQEQIITFFRNMNGTFDIEARKELLHNLLEEAEESECGCYEKFKQQVRQERDGKIPIQRYQEFMEKIKEYEKE